MKKRFKYCFNQLNLPIPNGEYCVDTLFYYAKWIGEISCDQVFCYKKCLFGGVHVTET